jgi:AAA+ superfamily predicted ATPase
VKSKLTSYVKAGFAALYCVTYEEERITKEIIGMAKEIKYNIWSWSVTTGLESGGDKLPNTVDPLKALSAFIEHEPDDDGQPQGKHIPNKSIVILKDFHMFLRGNPPPILIRLLKEAIIIGRASNRHLIILGCVLNLPPELEKEITVIEFSLPTREELNEVLEDIAKAAKVEINGNRDLLLDAGSGLTTTEYADSLAYSKVEVGDLDPGTVSKIKAETIKKNGILEIVTQKVTLDDIGGLDLLKADLFGKRNLFTKAAKEYGLPSPRPLLCVGQAGTGKSLTATATASVFGIPLLRLEAGRLFGSLVGESERNWRTAFGTAKAVTPAVVWIDEIDGLFSGAESSGRTDGGTTQRVVKAILQDLQYNADGLFFVFTANDIDGLPDPLIDRCEVWNVELPNESERYAIWKIHISKRKRNWENYDLGGFANRTDGFSGRQIEQAWLKAMTLAFNANGRQVCDSDVTAVLKEFVPTSVTMKDAIEARRKRLANCAKPASSPITTKKASTQRKIA